MPTPLGGVLIRRWTGFADWMSTAAHSFGHRWPLDEAAQVEVERILAGLGGPPAPGQLSVRLSADAAATLCLFLLLQPEPSRTILQGPEAGSVMARLKSWVMLTAQGAVPYLGIEALGFRGFCLHLGAEGAALRLNLTFDADGRITGLQRPGGAADLRVEEYLPGTACDLLLAVGATEPAPLPPAGAGHFSPTGVGLTLV